MKKSRLIRFLSLVLCVATLLCACQTGDQNTTTTASNNQSENASYKVTVIGVDGKPAQDVYVRFFQNGNQLAMIKLDEGGVAVYEGAKGEYTVELRFTDSEADYTYDASDLKLTAEKNELTIELLNKPSEETETIFVPVDGDHQEYEATYITSGRTQVTLEPGKRNYFIYRPTETGFFEFSFTGDIEKLDQYGMPFNVLAYGVGDKVEGKENVFTYNYHPGYLTEGGTPMVIGIDAKEGTTGGIINILRISDYIVTPDIAPWTIYQTTAALTPWTKPEGATTVDFDVTKAYTIVYNEEDGYYHKDTADGPLVLLKLGTAADNSCKYMTSMESFIGLNVLGMYIYDENGEFDYKIGFAECIRDHLKYVDEKSGLYPVTQDLYHILTTFGEYKGWWDIESKNYLFFKAIGEEYIPYEVNVEIAWLYNCCYIPQ